MFSANLRHALLNQFKAFLIGQSHQHTLLSNSSRGLTTTSHMLKKKSEHHLLRHPNDVGRKPYSQNKVTKPRPQLTGKEILVKMENKARGLKIRESYYAGVSSVIEQFKFDISEQHAKKFDTEGSYMKRIQQNKIERLEKKQIYAKTAEELAIKRQETEADIQLKNERRQQMIIERKARQMSEMHQENIKLVLQAIEEQKNFVTPENLDEKIEFALENPTNYNFAIASNRKKLHSTKPPGNLEEIAPESTYHLSVGSTAGKIPVKEKIPLATSKFYPGPHAYTLGGILPGSEEWDQIFKNTVQTFDEKFLSFEHRKQKTKLISGKFKGSHSQEMNET